MPVVSPKNTKHRILLVDDHPIVRQGLAEMINQERELLVCGTAVQRIRYADNETNYCARCQTGGRLLADRALSRLLHGDWPKSIDEL